jgi:hypothetical protein
MTTLHADVGTDLGTLATRLNALSAALALTGGPAPQPTRPAGTPPPFVPPMPTRPSVRPTGPAAPATPPSQPTQSVQPTGAPTPTSMPTGAPTPPPMPGTGKPTGPRPTRPIVQPGQTAAQPGAGATTGAQPSGQRPAAPGGLMGELAGRLGGLGGAGKRPQPVTPGKPGAAAPAQAARPRVMRGVQEAWKPAVTMPMGNVNWNNYLPYNDDSYFNPQQNVMYSQNAAGQAINQIRTALSNASYSQAEGFSRVNSAQLTAALNNLKTVFGKSAVALGSVTEDKRRNLLEALFVAITIAPHDIAADIVKNSIEVIALENEYAPGTIFSYLADMYVGSAVNALRTEVDREIRVKATEELQGVTQSKRQGHIATLGRRINAVLSRLHNALIVYEMYAGNPNISMLDKDLYLSKLMCSWHMVEAMYHELQEVLTPDEYTRLKAGMKIGSEVIPSVLNGINATAQRLNQLLTNYSRPLINVLQVLDEMRRHDTVAHLTDFINSYIPEVPQQVGAAVAGGKVDYEQQINQQREALLQSFVRCHYHMFDTQDKLEDVENMLDAANNRLNSVEAKQRLDAVKERMKAYREQYIRNQKVNKVVQRIETDPELSANPEKIKEVIDDIAQMARKREIDIKEAQDLLNALGARYEVIKFAHDTAVNFGYELLRIEYSGNRDKILADIRKYIYDKPGYATATVEKTTYQMTIESGQVIMNQKTEQIELSGQELNERRKTVLQSAVAYLTDLVFKNEMKARATSKYSRCSEVADNLTENILDSWKDVEFVNCLRCTYNAAWLIAQNPLLNSSDSPWVEALRSLPYNVNMAGKYEDSEGKLLNELIDLDGNPTEGYWYPWRMFVFLFGKEFYDIRMDESKLNQCPVWD